MQVESNHCYNVGKIKLADKLIQAFLSLSLVQYKEMFDSWILTAQRHFHFKKYHFKLHTSVSSLKSNMAASLNYYLA